MKSRNICIALVIGVTFLSSFATAGGLEVYAPNSVHCGEVFDVLVRCDGRPVQDAIVLMIDPDSNAIIEEAKTDSRGEVHFSVPLVRRVKIIATKGEMSGETVIKVR